MMGLWNAIPIGFVEMLLKRDTVPAWIVFQSAEGLKNPCCYKRRAMEDNREENNRWWTEVIINCLLALSVGKILFEIQINWSAVWICAALMLGTEHIAARFGCQKSRKGAVQVIWNNVFHSAVLPGLSSVWKVLDTSFVWSELVREPFVVYPCHKHMT